MSVLLFKEKKLKGNKICMITCYDYTSARILNQSQVDSILVGDSLAMTMYGHPSTIPATIDLMSAHTEAVVRGAPDKFIVADLPFLSFRGDLNKSISSVEALMKAGAHAVKLEGVAGNESLIEHLVQSGVPVMGHLGLTPQFVNLLGGYRVQGREADQSQLILDAAKKLESCGCFSVVLECVPAPLGARISQNLSIPTIGIGAGPDTDGQILVFQDLLGMNTAFKPKFVRNYLNGNDLILNAVNQYSSDVTSKCFPSLQESYE